MTAAPPPTDRLQMGTARARWVLLTTVLGSSLAIRSGLRFVTRAAELGIPIAIVNQGPTGGDGDASLTLDAPLGPTLTDLTARLGAQ